MGRVESSAPDQFVCRSGGGCLMLFGLPFLLAGLFVMSIPFLPGSMRQGNPPQWFFAIPFGAIFATVGAALVFGRAGTIVDRRMGTVTTWWGLLVPFRRKERPLSDFDSVVVSREVRRSKNSTYTVYPVRMAGPGEGEVKIEEGRDLNKARAMGEEVAKFLGVKLVDRSMGTTVVREADELDESLRERKERKGEQVAVPDTPAERRAQQSVVGDTLAFDIPPRGFTPILLVPLAIGLVIPTVVYFAFLRHVLGDEKMPLPVKLLFTAFIGGFFIALPLLVTWGGALSSARRRARVEVSPTELRVTQSGLLPGRAKLILTAELEELEIVGESVAKGQASSTPKFLGGARHVIVARSDRATLTFGAGLSREELEWMRAIIWNVVTA